MRKSNWKETRKINRKEKINEKTSEKKEENNNRDSNDIDVKCVYNRNVYAKNFSMWDKLVKYNRIFGIERRWEYEHS